jgi:ABC-type uncharacterized transport system involved in gliding motility auxiliary subunit
MTMTDDDFSNPTFSTRRKVASRLNALIAVAAALAVVVMLNYLAARHFVRRDLDTRRSQLSSQTVRVLASLTNDVRVTIFFDTRDQEELAALTTTLLREYTYASPRVTLKVIDPTREPSRAELLLAKYKLTTLKGKDFVIFDCDGRTKVVYENELSDYDANAVVSGKSKEFRRIAFRGELLFTTAIFNLANPRQFKVCFLTGHGEHDPEKAEQPHGYAKFAALLTEEANAPWEKLSLLGANEVPADCQLLVIAGPRLPFADEELEKISRFLKQGGRLFALAGNAVYSGGKKIGLEKLLAQWGVGVADDVVFDEQNHMSDQDLLAAKLNPEHPVTKALLTTDEALRIKFILPRSLGRSTAAAAGGPDAPKLDVLVATGDAATEATDVRDGVIYKNSYAARSGSFPLVMAAEQGFVKGVTTERGAMRMIVVGDSLLLDNEIIETAPGNHPFAALAVNWLLDRPPVLLQGLLPRPLTEYRIVMDVTQRQVAGFVLLVGLPLGVLIFGALVWWRRSK